MAPLLVFLTVFAIFSSVVSQKSASALYPNWSCKKGYDQSEKTQHRGSGWIQYSMRRCGYEHKIDSPCYQFCIMKIHDIFSPSESQILSTEEEIVDSLRLSVFNTRDSAEKIAKSILSKCGVMGNQFEKKHCSEGSKLYNCIESAWESCDE